MQIKLHKYSMFNTFMFVHLATVVMSGIHGRATVVMSGIHGRATVVMSGIHGRATVGTSYWL